ncbi:MAG: D-glycero-beta-D-manno-heptose 1-phosphate adenylyltransferase [Bacteroidales bacterium]
MNTKELLERKPLELITDKIIERSRLPQLRAIWTMKEKTIVFTNGCFDILHRGHIESLAQARALGTKLVVGLNSDASVRRLKGAKRPVQDQQTRALVLASLQFVSHVVIFDEDTPYELIKLVQPDILVKGADYNAQDVVGYDIVTANGGQVISIPLIEGYSTSKLVEKMKH